MKRIVIAATVAALGLGLAACGTDTSTDDRARAQLEDIIGYGFDDAWFDDWKHRAVVVCGEFERRPDSIFVFEDTLDMIVEQEPVEDREALRRVMRLGPETYCPEALR